MLFRSLSTGPGPMRRHTPTSPARAWSWPARARTLRRPRPCACAPPTAPTAWRSASSSWPARDDGAGDAGASAGLLLFFNHRLFLGLELSRGRLQAWTGGTRTWGGEPLPEDVRALELAIVKRENIVDMHYRMPGAEEWTHYPLTLECSGYHANTINDLVSLRPAVFAAGNGRARDRDRKSVV